MTKPLNQELTELLAWLCINGGFCSIPEADRQNLVNRQSLTADEFAVAVLAGEGFMEPETELQWMRYLKRVFVERFGGASVSAGAFGRLSGPGTQT